VAIVQALSKEFGRHGHRKMKFLIFMFIFSYIVFSYHWNRWPLVSPEHEDLADLYWEETADV